MDSSVTTHTLRPRAGQGLRQRFSGGLLQWWRSGRAGREDGPPSLPPPPELIYRLRAWPVLAEHQRTADVYRMLSVMSSRPVNRSWVLHTTQMSEAFLDQLLAALIAEGAVEVIDPALFTPGAGTL